MENIISTFSLPWRIRLTILFIIPSIFALLKINEYTTLDLVTILISNTIMVFCLWFISFSISKEGIIFNKFRKLVWADIADAYNKRILGLKYIRLKMKSGKKLDIPLYYIGENTVKNILQNHVPENNPLYKVTNTI